MRTSGRPRIALALGDPAGIGPEIALKAAMDPRVLAMCQPVLFGDRGVLETHAHACGLTPSILRVSSAGELPFGENGIVLVERSQFASGELRIGEVAAAHGRSALDSAGAAIAAAMDGAVDAVVAAPQTERAIKLAGIEFDGYPTFVARCTGTPLEDAYLMLCFDDGQREVRIVHATLHVSLRRALDLLTRTRILSVIQATHAALQRIGGNAPRIAVGGVNPHASEDGLFGDEEAHVVEPAIADAKRAGIAAEGPFGADTMVHQRGFDAYVVMYHDQGHIAAKAMAHNRTAGLTIGTPVLFSSVAHGSALDIAGRNQADASAMVEAIRRVVGASAASAGNGEGKP